MDIKESAILGHSVEQHWYYRSKAAAVARYLLGSSPQRVLDVGAGSGFFTRYLLEHTSASEGICVDTAYPRDWDEQWFGKPVAFRRSCDRVDADLVLLMDVLEHVDDDVGLLADYAARVPSGARFLLTVPAFQWLWSGHDVFLEHRRRYRLRALETVVERAGLRVLRSSYFYGLILPIAAVLRLAQRIGDPANVGARSQLVRHSWAINSLLLSLCLAELPLMRANRVGGLSAFCLASKP